MEPEIQTMFDRFRHEANLIFDTVVTGQTKKASYTTGGHEERINESRLCPLKRPLKDALSAMIPPRRRSPRPDSCLGVVCWGKENKN